MKKAKVWARDSQRARLYKAEGDAWGFLNPHMCPELSLNECRNIVAEAWGWAGLLYPPTVSDGRGRRTACGNPWEIKLPRWSRKPWIVLHEVAHGIVRKRMKEWCTAAPHGREFTSIYLKLVRRFVGRDAAALLREAYQANRVKWTVRKEGGKQ